VRLSAGCPCPKKRSQLLGARKVGRAIATDVVLRSVRFDGQSKEDALVRLDVDADDGPTVDLLRGDGARWIWDHESLYQVVHSTLQLGRIPLQTYHSASVVVAIDTKQRRPTLSR